MSIPRKLKICIDCQSPQYLFSHGRCKSCYTINYPSQIRNSDRLEKSKRLYQTTTIKRTPTKPHDEYKEFFESLVIPERCEECNQVILAFNNFGRRCVSAHILPKQTFKSVAKHPDNILFMGAGLLGACNHHDMWDRGIENRKSMRVYPLALARLESFKHLLTDKELVMAEKYLGINKINKI